MKLQQYCESYWFMCADCWSSTTMQNTEGQAIYNANRRPGDTGCIWTCDDHYFDGYQTSCGEEYAFDDGDLEESGYNFCPNCGRKIALKEREA